MAQQLDIVHYAEALKILEATIIDVKPIKKTEFTKTHKLDGRIFKIMEDMGILKVLGSSKPAGTIYDWKYTKASNATATHLAGRVTAAIYDLNQEAYKHYSSEGYRKKKAKRDYKEEQRALAQHSKECRCSVCRMKNLQPIERMVVQQEEPVREQYITIHEPEHRILVKAIPEVEPKQKKELAHKTVNFKLEGELTKDEILEKLGILLSNKQISSFEIKVVY